MNKSDLIKYVSDKTMIKEDDAYTIIDVFIRGMKEGLVNDDKVTIKNFGTFFLQERSARKAVDPRNQEPVNVPAKTVVKFKSSKKLFNEVNGNG